MDRGPNRSICTELNRTKLSGAAEVCILADDEEEDRGGIRIVYSSNNNSRSTRRQILQDEGCAGAALFSSSQLLRNSRVDEMTRLTYTESTEIEEGVEQE